MRGATTSAARRLAYSLQRHTPAIRSCVPVVSTRRTQSSLAATAPYGHATSPQQQQQQRYRPQVNGKAIPLHITDLYNSQSSAAAALETDDEYYDEQEQQQQEQQQLYEDAAGVAKQYDSDLVVVLDMDECLIHSQFLSSPQTAQVYAHQLAQQRRQSANGGSKGVVDHFKITLPEGDLVHVNLRPGLKDFLTQVTERFETHIFTAASAIYAKPVLDNLDPGGTMFAGRWYREHCQYVEQPQRAYIKNLDNLPCLVDRMSRAVLVDNNPLSFLTHPENGILISSFYTDPHDTSLRTVWKLLQKLDDHKDDVRPILTEKFGLEQALQKMEAQKVAQKNQLAW